MRRFTAHIVFALSMSTTGALAQSDTYWEIRPIAGIAVPTGAQRSVIGDAAFVGAATSLRLNASFDLVASFAFQSSSAKYRVADNHAHVLVYNAGIERLYRPSTVGLSGSWVPFVGAGVGGRAYDFRSSALSSTACFSGYGNAGMEYERPRTTMRLEVRDNLYCYKQPIAPFARVTRNEVSVGLGAGVRF
jgi:hypothetical protein